MVNLNPINPELMTERIMDTLPLKVGELLAARVLQVEGRLFYLLLADGTLLRARLNAELELQQGEEMVFQVKSITEGRIELSVVTDEKGVNDASKSTEAGYRIRADREDAGIICKLLERGLPAAPENIKEIKSAVSLLSFILKNSALVERGLKISREEDLIHQPIDRLVKWLVGSEQPDSIEGLDAQHQKLMLILEELAGVEVEDIITLMRFGLKITPGNLMLAKNLRENKGFPGILLKSIYEEPESMDKTQRPNGQPKAEEETAFWEAAKGRREDRKGPGAQNLAGSKAEPVDLKNLLKGIIESNRAAPRQRAAAELLMERVRFLEEVLSDRNLLVFPFLFDGQISECWIRVSQGNGKFKQQESELELVVETEPPNLGSIRVQIKLKDKRVDLNFFVLKEQAKSLIEKEKENLRQSIERSGFSVNRISCRRMEDIRPETVRRFLDLRV
ncbi:MAG: flagellar hook-length control protein FliK [Clostridia bacterium]|jgi:hypothetical protein